MGSLLTERAKGELSPRNTLELAVYHFAPMRFQTGDKRDPFCQTGIRSMPKHPRSSNICLDESAVRHRVSYSLQNIGRLEAAGVFPKRIHLGPARVGWPLRDVLGWMQAKVDARRPGPMSAKVIVGPDDRFIRKKELRTLVLYSDEHIRKLELAGGFPGRIRIGDNSVAWLEREVRDWIDGKRGSGPNRCLRRCRAPNSQVPSGRYKSTGKQTGFVTPM